jgi:hypothetical protein
MINIIEVLKNECEELGLKLGDMPFVFNTGEVIDYTKITKTIIWILKKRQDIMFAKLLEPEGEQCQVCKRTAEDMRTLRMSCLYDMTELDVPFKSEDSEDGISHTLRVCKDCRGSWMEAIENWYEEKSKL